LLAHEYFEELAAVGSLGELTPTQSRELNDHLTDCADCKEMLRQYEQLHAPLHQPLDPEMEPLVESRRSSVRAAVLEEIAARQAGPLVAKQPVLGPGGIGWSARRTAWSVLASAAAVTIAFWSGVRYERNAFGQAKDRPVAATVREIANVQGPQTVSGSQLPRERNTTDQKNVELTAKLNAEQFRSAALDAALMKKDGEVTETQRERLLVQDQLEAQKEETRRAQSLLDAKNEQLKQLEAANTTDSSTLVALRYEVRDLTEKLNDKTQSLDRERQLLANGRDVRDIIGARNLHIIDVYDTDPGGKTRKSFARAFYTEGKSLIFYAYDLPAHGMEDGKFVYAAWGERNGNKNKVQKLGILLNDDKGQKRWALNFSDPKVLNEIDSVFVTLERVDMNGAEPKGKRMLTAYLDSQINHP
jgi:hypothetical protein